MILMSPLLSNLTVKSQFYTITISYFHQNLSMLAELGEVNSSFFFFFDWHHDVIT